MTKKAVSQQEKFSLQDIQKCAGKKVYGSKNEARDFARARHWAQMPYKCPLCRSWHLTHHDSENRVIVREKVNARMTQPSKIPAGINTTPKIGSLRSPRYAPTEHFGFRIGQAVITPSGKSAKVTGFTGFHKRSGSVRVICQYVGEDRRTGVVWLLPEALRAVRVDGD